MKQRFKLNAIVIVAVVVYFVMSNKINKNDDLVFRNIEALSMNEGGGCDFGVVAYDEGTNKLYCFDLGSRCCVYSPNFN